MTTDRLVFRAPARQFSVGWTGPWPPPARLVVITGALTGQAAIADVDDQRPGMAEVLEDLVAGGATVEYYRLASASEMTEAAPPGAHWFRGAAYEPEADPTHGRIDRDIQSAVAAMNPSSVGQRVAIEHTLQEKRDRAGGRADG